MGKSSVREYAILFVGKGGKSASGTIGGGNAILNAGQHALDGPEHTGQLPIERLSTADLDATRVLAPDGAGGITTRVQPGTHLDTVDPDLTDDSDAGYSVGWRWINTSSGEEFVAVDVTAGAAVWTSTTAGGAGGSGGLVPYYIPVDETFTVPLYKQALFSEPIEVDGALVVNGLLIGVD